MDIEGFAISQGKEVDGREGVDWGLASDFCSSLVVELGGGDNGGAARVGSRSSVHADLVVLSAGRGDWDSMFNFDVDIDGR